MTKLLVVEGDHNDADYICSINPITNAQLKKFKPLFDAIKNFKPYKGISTNYGLSYTHSHNWPVGEYGNRADLGEKSILEYYGALGINSDLITEFDEDFVPHEAGNIHSINRILVVTKEKDFLGENNG